MELSKLVRPFHSGGSMARHQVHVYGTKSYVRSIGHEDFELLNKAVLKVLEKYGVHVNTDKVWPTNASPWKRFLTNGILDNFGIGVDPSVRRKGPRNRYERLDIGLTAERLRLLIVDLVLEMIVLGMPPRSYRDIDYLHCDVRRFISERKYVCPYTLTHWGKDRWEIPGEEGWENYLKNLHPDLHDELAAIWATSQKPSVTPTE